VTILFHWEARPDKIAFGTGASVAAITQRLQTIDIDVSGNRRSAYKLTYEQGTSRGISRLTLVRQYGKGAARACAISHRPTSTWDTVKPACCKKNGVKRQTIEARRLHRGKPLHKMTNQIS